MYDVVVLGAGIVGLSTAVNIQNLLPNREVTVIADKFTRDTTSDGAAGMFRVTLGLTPVKSVTKYRKWCEDSFRWYHKLHTSYDPKETGVIRVTGYQFSDTKQYPFHHDIIYDFKEITEAELKGFHGNQRYGWKYTTLMTESRRYLPWLQNMFLSNGGTIEDRTVSDIQEFAGNCNVLVNCSGLNAAKLFNDKEVFPVRGHLIRVKAPWLKHFFVWDDGSSYIYTGQDNVVLGGTRQKNETDITPSNKWFDNVMERCAKLQPALKDAEIERRWTGLRPHRTYVRVESETIIVGHNKIQVVHNYGHGANGIALSWGTAVDAANIVKDILDIPLSKL